MLNASGSGKFVSGPLESIDAVSRLAVVNIATNAL
jgi:hypothetical protein